MSTCPRCRHEMETIDGAHAGAMSRATPGRDIEICSACGEDEVWFPAPFSAWPLKDPHARLIANQTAWIAETRGFTIHQGADGYFLTDDDGNVVKKGTIPALTVHMLAAS